jgi:hypothetical protein
MGVERSVGVIRADVMRMLGDTWTMDGYIPSTERYDRARKRSRIGHKHIPTRISGLRSFYWWGGGVGSMPTDHSTLCSSGG